MARVRRARDAKSSGSRRSKPERRSRQNRLVCAMSGSTHRSCKSPASREESKRCWCRSLFRQRSMLGPSDPLPGGTSLDQASGRSSASALSSFFVKLSIRTSSCPRFSACIAVAGAKASAEKSPARADKLRLCQQARAAVRVSSVSALRRSMTSALPCATEPPLLRSYRCRRTRRRRFLRDRHGTG